MLKMDEKGVYWTNRKKKTHAFRWVSATKIIIMHSLSGRHKLQT